MYETKRRHSVAHSISTPSAFFYKKEEKEYDSLQTPKRRFSVNQQFPNLFFGQYDEAGSARLEEQLRMNFESDSEAEFTDEINFSEMSDESDGLSPEFSWLKHTICDTQGCSVDSIDFASFEQGFQTLGTSFYSRQLAAVFKHISPDKSPIPFTPDIVNFLSNPCDDPLLESHRKTICTNLTKQFRLYHQYIQNHTAEKDSSEFDISNSLERIPDEEFQPVEETMETLKEKNSKYEEKIDDLEIELQNSGVELKRANDRVDHLNKKIKILEDGEKIHTHQLTVKAMIRVGEDVKSKRLRIMPEGSMVRVIETRGNRALIDFPVEGWCSIMAKDGRHILQILEESETPNYYEEVLEPILRRLQNENISAGTRELISRIQDSKNDLMGVDYSDFQFEQTEFLSENLAGEVGKIPDDFAALNDQGEEIDDETNFMSIIGNLQNEIAELKQSKINLIISTAEEIDRLNGIIITELR